MSEVENVLERELAIIELREELTAAGHPEVEAVIGVLFNPMLALSKVERDNLLAAGTTLKGDWSWMNELLEEWQPSDVSEVVRLWVRDPFVAYREDADDFFIAAPHGEQYLLHASTKDLEEVIAHYQQVLEVCKQYGITEWLNTG